MTPRLDPDPLTDPGIWDCPDDDPDSGLWIGGVFLALVVLAVVLALGIVIATAGA